MIIKPEELKIVYEKEDDGRIRPVYFIDAEPVRRGRWVNKNNGKWNTLPVFMCSECGDYDPRLYGNENYCPNCGARMDGD